MLPTTTGPEDLRLILAHLSHELRTPLSAILGHTDLMLSDDAPPPLRSHLEVVRRNVDHLLVLLDDLLDLSRIESGTLEIELQTVDLGAILADLRSLLAQRAADKGIGLSIRIEEGVPRLIRTDPVRFRQILINLVSNAIKFTEKGRVRVVASLVPRSDAPDSEERERPLLRVAVHDSGVGISRRDRRRLFRPFVQVGREEGVRREGCGLGLAISRQLAIRLGGDIAVKSSSGVGSTFAVLIDPGEIPSAAPSASAGGTILLVEDDPDARRATARILERLGWAVVAANSGAAALAAAAVPGAAPRLALIDLSLPDIDGYDLVARLRATGFAATSFVSLSGRDADARRAAEVGVERHLRKPAGIGVLRSLTESYGGRAESDPPRNCPP